MLRIVAGRARHCAGRGQAGIGEDLLAECDGIGTVGIARCRNDAACARDRPRTAAPRATDTALVQNHFVRRAWRGLEDFCCIASPAQCECRLIGTTATLWRLVYQGWLAGGVIARWLAKSVLRLLGENQLSKARLAQEVNRFIVQNRELRSAIQQRRAVDHARRCRVIVRSLASNCRRRRCPSRSRDRAHHSSVSSCDCW